MKRNLTKYLNRAGILILFIVFAVTGFSQKSPCGISKSNGGGFTSAIQSVVCNQNGTYTFVLHVEHNGCPGPICKALSHYSVEADPGTYSNISVQILTGGMSYTNIDLGPNLGGDPFQGFKIDGVSGIGNGQAGSFNITYTLTGSLQDEQVSAKAGLFPQLASFTIAEFTSVMNCNNTACGTPVTGPDAINDNAATTINTPVNINILTNDIPGSGALVPGSVTFISGTAPPVSVGVFTIFSPGVVKFTPANNYTGTATINYQVCDVNSLCDIATITVTITGSPIIGPDAINDNATTTINTPVNINILTNDIPGSGALVPGSVTFVAGTAPPVSSGLFTILSPGVAKFTPANNYFGTATINYQVCDVNSLCDIATITVTIPSGGGDSDNDGCPDDVDEYPNDPTRCFDNNFPAVGTGTLAYEDLWPGQGDYDFNDLVCDYKFTSVTNASNKVVELTGTFTVNAFGASLHNGFGFQFPNNNIMPGSMTVSGYNLQESYIVLNGQGLEAGQSKPTVIVYDDAYNLMPNPGMGIGVNTTPGTPYVTPVTLTIHMVFNPPQYTMLQINIQNFNPFIIVDQNRGLEVHLPDYPPTSLANPAYFAQAQDDSKPSIGRYYKTSNNLPWAINIYESFAYPKEKIDIINTYTHFVQWATSGGVNYPDWYMNKPGYRNAGNIYTH